MDDPYRDADLVALYDGDNPDGVDHDYYRVLADRIGARRIIDLGCGTGLLTRTLALPGRSVIGIDPSRTMLDWARRQPTAHTVTWVEGDATSITPSRSVDLAICTGNTIMHLDRAELTVALTRISAALCPGGMFAFESRNPSAHQWEQWTRKATFGERDTTLGRLTEWIEVTEVVGDRVTFDAHTVFASGEDRVYTSVLFFRDAEVFRSALCDAGFGDVTIDGGWFGEELAATSRLLVVRARRA